MNVVQVASSGQTPPRCDVWRSPRLNLRSAPVSPLRPSIVHNNCKSANRKPDILYFVSLCDFSPVDSLKPMNDGMRPHLEIAKYKTSEIQRIHVQTQVSSVYFVGFIKAGDTNRRQTRQEVQEGKNVGFNK